MITSKLGRTRAVSFILGLMISTLLLLLPRRVHALSTTKRTNSNTVSTTLQYFAGQRCYVLQRQECKKQVPLLLLPGTAQSIDTWQQLHALPILQQSTCYDTVIVYESIGSGPGSTNILDASLPAQARQLKATLACVLDTLSNDGSNKYDTIDIAGFSLGGRIALATLLDDSLPLHIRTLHLTGVSARRDEYGQLQLQQWLDLLQNIPNENDAMYAFAWAAMSASYSPTFLYKNRHKLPDWIKSLQERQTRQGLIKILQDTSDNDEKWSVASMLEQLQSKSTPTMHFCAGQDDRIAPSSLVAKAAKLAKASCTFVPNANHALPIERPQEWQNDLLQFVQANCEVVNE